jgi:membrane protein DedA with SNARE-associated domain
LDLRRNLERLKGKTPQLLLIALVAIAIVIVLLDTMEDTLIEGGSFTGTPLATISNAIITLAQGATTTVSSWGYAGIFLLMLLEASSLPIPSEVILPFSGYLVSTGQLNLWITILVSTLAGIAGSLIDYYIGMKGTNFLARRRVLDKLLFSKTRLEMAATWFDKYGAFAVFLGRMIPGFRTLVSFPAGAVKMSIRKFVVYTTGGCLVWNAFLVYFGVYLGTNWRAVAGVSRYLIIGVVATILVALVVLLIRRKNRASQTLSL